MEMQQLRYVVAVARAGNFSRAAEQCHVAQPSSSQQIQKLEDELASGARSPAAPGSTTVMPTVSTRKNVPMNSTRYFFISPISIVGRRAVSIFSRGRASFHDLQSEE
jgi:hypothetical protein